jgi:diphthine-ammonia ligase
MRVAILWTGGKDSFSAYEKILEEGHKVVCLVTFTGGKPFLCHPIECMELQSTALGLPYRMVNVHEPYLQGYRKALKSLIKEFGIEAIATGDIAVVDDFHGNWIDDVCKGTKLAILRPLWEINRHEHLKRLLVSGSKIVFTCVMKKWFDQSWLGRIMDDKTIVELEAYSQKYGIDPCGEGGEYHTMVLDSPKFNQRIDITWHEDGETDTLRFAKFEGFWLKAKK